MTRLMSAVIWSTICGIVLPLLMRAFVPIPWDAILGYMFGTVATGGSILIANIQPDVGQETSTRPTETAVHRGNVARASRRSMERNELHAAHEHSRHSR